MASYPPQKRAEFLKALELGLGNISHACKVVRIHRDTYYKWVKKYPKFAKECENITEAQIDYVESKLHEQIHNGNIVAILFYLKCKAKKRGYVERFEVDLPDTIEVEFSEHETNDKIT